MPSHDFTEVFLIGLAISFVVSIPGLGPLIFWIRRSTGDPARILARRPTLPWWGRGFIGQFLVFLTLSFWIGLAVGLLLLLGETLSGYELSDSLTRALRYGVMGGSIGLTMQLYQRAAAIAFPPHFSRQEKKALKNLNPAAGDLETAIDEYQAKLVRGLTGLRPLAAGGVNFYDPQSPHSLLATVSWTQVVCVPFYFTNKYIVLYLEPPVPQVLHKVAHGRKANFYRLYFSTYNVLAAGLKMQALAKRLWADKHESSLGEFSDPLARQAVKYFD